MKQWRKNQTTIVITHDLSQIVPDDFVYVMANGIVAEQGFRKDLIKRVPGVATGVFGAMAAEQAIEPLPPKVEEWKDRPEDEEVLEEFDAYEEYENPTRRASFRPHTPTFGLAGRESMAYYDVLDDYAKGEKRSTRRLSWSAEELDKRASRTSLTIPLTLVGSRQSGYLAPGAGNRHRSDGPLSRRKPTKPSYSLSRTQPLVPQRQPRYQPRHLDRRKGNRKGGSRRHRYAPIFFHPTKRCTSSRRTRGQARWNLQSPMDVPTDPPSTTNISSSVC